MINPPPDHDPPSADPGSEACNGSRELGAIIRQAGWGAAEHDQVLAIVTRIIPDDSDSWTLEWIWTAGQAWAAANTALVAGRTAQAATSFPHAATYYGAALRQLPWSSERDRRPALWQRHRRCWELAVDLLPLDVQHLELPYDGTTLPAYLFIAPGATGRRPLVIVHNGATAPTPAMWGLGGAAAAERGYHWLTFDGPGQQSAFHDRRLMFRPDWEAVLTQVLDAVTRLPAVDPQRIVALGVGQAGYWLPRALQHEHRLAAVVVGPGVVDVRTAWEDMLGDELVTIHRSGQGPAFERALRAELLFDPSRLLEIDARAAPYGHSHVGHEPRKLDSTIKLKGQQTWGQQLRASRRTLIGELAPLRRPQTAAERAIARTLNRHELPFEEFYGTPDRSLVRYAATTPWGQRLYLVPITPWTARQTQAREGKHVHAPPPVEEFAVYAPGTSFVVGAGNAARIRAGTVGVSFWGPGGPKSGVTQELQVVPDGVEKVAYVLPRQPQAEFGYPVYPRVGHLTVAVHGNIVAFQTRRAVGTASIWYAADGRVLRRFGNAAAAAKVVPVKQPGPETARSRAAERDPSTPDPVAVTEVGSGRTASFTLHFQALLNGADYGYEWSGPRCPGITLPYGFSRDVILRGHTVSTKLPLAPSQPGCAGIYHVAVRVTGLEPIGSIRPVSRKVTARPFGTATFTVR